MANDKIKTYPDIVTGEPVELDVSQLVKGILKMSDDLRPVIFGATWIESRTLNTLLRSGYTLPVWGYDLVDEHDDAQVYNWQRITRID